MAIPVAKKKKRRGLTPEQKIKMLEEENKRLRASRLDEFATTVAMMFAILLRDLWTVKGWRIKRVSERLFSQLILFSEVADGINTPIGEIKDAEEETGINTLKLVNEIRNGKEISLDDIINLMEKQKNKEKVSK